MRQVLAASTGHRMMRCFLALLLSVTNLLPIFSLPQAFAEGEQTAAATPSMPATQSSATDAKSETSADKALKEKSLEFTLTEGKKPSEQPVVIPIATPVDLPITRAEQILSRLPAITKPDKQPFVIPEQSLVKPDRPGIIEQQPFPPKVSLSAPKIERPISPKVIAPLTVQSMSHDGNVDSIYQFSVTFSQPMVPLTEVSRSTDASKFITLSPQPPGTWKWAGPQTLQFDPDPKINRFPKSTNYRVSIPSGLTSVSGGRLAQEQRWAISTPPVVVTDFYPYSSTQPLKPTMILAFDQDIDPDRMLASVRVTAAGKNFSLKRVSTDSFQKLSMESAFVQGKSEKSLLAFQATTDFPYDSKVIVTVKPGAPSDEGPIKTSKEQVLNFKVHGPLKLVSVPTTLLMPHESVHFGFSNLLDREKFKESMVTIEPSAEDFKVVGGGEYITVSGNFKPLTKYTVTFESSLTDVFGQTLGKNLSTTFNTRRHYPELRMSEVLATIPSGHKPEYSIWARAVDHLDLTVYRVKPEDWLSFEKERNRPINLRDNQWTIAKRETVRISEEGTIHTVDLRSFLKNNYGHFVILAETGQPKIKERFARAIWVQVTDLGVDVFCGRKLNTLTTSLASGQPVENASITLASLHSAFMPAKGVSNKSGTAALPTTSDHGSLLIASKGDDSTILPSNLTGRYWNYHSSSNEIRWFAASDRKLYKPGETVNIKGWMRKYSLDQNESIQLSNSGVAIVSYLVRSLDNKELGRGKATVDRQGGFAFDLKLPDRVNLGSAHVVISTRPIDEPVPPQSALRRNENDRIDKPKPSDRTIDSSCTVAIDIQEFRRPEFEMKVASSLGNSMILGDKTSLTATAKYFSGSTLPNAPITWRAAVTQGSYAPPGWSEFAFGAANYFPWGSTHHRRGRSYRFRPTEMARKDLTGTTDSSGTHTANLQFQSFKAPLPMSCQCEATVTDVNRQTWSDTATLLIHAADTYVGVKQEKSFFHADEPIELKVVATDLNGKVTSGRPIKISLVRNGGEVPIEVETRTITSGSLPETVRLNSAKGGSYSIVVTTTDTSGRENETTVSTWVQGESKSTERTVDAQTLLIVPSQKEYQPGDAADILVNSPFYPAYGVLNVRRNTTISSTPIRIESSSASFKVPITSDLYPNCQIEVHLVGENNASASGFAEIKIPPKARRLSVTATPKEAETLPNSDTTISVDLKDSEGHPIAGGQVAVIVADEAHLALAGYKWPDPIEIFYPQISPNGDQASHSRQFVLRNKAISDRKGGSLIGAPVDPRFGQSNEIGRVEPPRDSNLFQVEPTVLDERHYTGGRAERHKKTSPTLPEGAPVPDADGESVKSERSINLRSNFSPLALFSPAITTDSNGKATVKFHLPDTVTRYRIMAAAVANYDKFGSSEGSLTARLPLTVKPSAPRFLNFGDRCQLPVVLQNETDKPITVDVAMRAENALLQDTNRITDISPGESSAEETNETNDKENRSTQENVIVSKQEVAGKSVKIPARDRVEVRFPVATLREGTAQFQCAAVAGSLSDASQFSIPVMVPASIESFAAYGELDKDGVAQRLERPTDVFDQVGGLTVTTSSTAMQALTDAYIYLYNYPYACSEQLSSRLLSMLSLEHVLSAFGKLEGADKIEFRRMVERDLEQLQTRQNSDGSFGLWKVNEPDHWPFVSMQVTRALTLAKEKDYAVDPEKLSRARNYLDHISNHIGSLYDYRSRLAIEAQALNIRFQMKDIDAAEARKILRSAVALSTKKLGSQMRTLSDAPVDLVTKNLSVECAAWLLPVVSKDKNSTEEADFLRRLLLSQIKETTSTASSNADSGYGFWDYCMFYSPRRTDAAVLEALMYDQPDSPLIPKIVRGLLGHRKNGMWDGTQENGAILQALDKYFGTYEKQTPDFETQMWLGETLIGMQKFAGRSAVSKEVTVPMSFIKKTDTEVLITKTGPGRLYYRLGLDYAPKALMMKAADFGFALERSYEAVEKPDDVKQDKNGVWHFKAGSVIRSKITFKAPGMRYHVALMDPLPAGAEPLNTELAGTQTMFDIKDNAHEYLPYRNRFFSDHENLRDHQAEAFSSIMRPGTYSYSYLMRATTPGNYRVAPTKAEEMYATETFGRAASENVVIE